MNILMVLTSHDRLGDTGKKTGFWLEEFAAPYYVFIDEGLDVTLASPAGGQPPLDPKSDEPDAQTDATRRFREDPEAQKALANTLRLADVKATDYDALFYPGGHGPLWDLAQDPNSIHLIESFERAGKATGFVCHAPGVLRQVRSENGEPLVRGRHVTGFTNAEEAAVGLTDVVPFLVEDELKRLGGLYEKAGNWQSHVVGDGRLVTGQNPASSEEAARTVLAMIEPRLP
ncbi:type 1 glutamine amidotransferase domain-containing protein [Pandoraea sp. SD6-2]|uniref:type 1 glutamine amidotransferase domain-containing protein n=1 Tax=Pandoraea sp. SD6-2 TaxID=1286093 RepID=UPI000330E89A|nr:type 1 glutamine amidotransferase domain-containing protein [Pandoraea sp. SD6-2]EON11029.1 NonF-like protein [Pandoraea sp. SD6-2]